MEKLELETDTNLCYYYGNHVYIFMNSYYICHSLIAEFIEF